jgi:8-oxo-dGTP pyrophosphatase MutT (NUDIX family)
MTPKTAKLVMIDKDNKYLIMYRSNHPYFGNDPDLPGGTHEDGESIEETIIREVFEEIGVEIDNVTKIYSGLEYSKHGTHKTLFVKRVDERPEITMSWEHASYEWIDRDDFLQKSKNANDTYMHMVYEVLSRSNEY